MSTENVLTIDAGIPLPEGAKRGSMHGQYRDKLLAMKIGDSFFFENKTREDLRGLVRYAKGLEVHLMARDTDEDEVYLTPGVRTWRVDQEDLPGRKPNKAEPTYWINRDLDVMYTCVPGETPTDRGAVQIAPAEFNMLAEGIRYWYHAESESAFMMHYGEVPQGADGAFCDQITQERFEEIMAAQEVEFGGNYWSDADRKVVVEYLPGKYPHHEQKRVRATRDEFLTYRASTITVDTYWRKADGVCVKVPPKKYLTACKTEGAILITKDEFETYRRSLEVGDEL